MRDAVSKSLSLTRPFRLSTRRLQEMKDVFIDICPYVISPIMLSRSTSNLPFVVVILRTYSERAYVHGRQHITKASSPRHTLSLFVCSC